METDEESVLRVLNTTAKFFSKVRSATACSQETATNLSAPHLSVYLTVNSLAKLVKKTTPYHTFLTSCPKGFLERQFPKAKAGVELGGSTRSSRVRLCWSLQVRYCLLNTSSYTD